MSNLEDLQKHLDDLRRHRVRPERDTSTAFLQRYFKTQIQKPYQQLKGLGKIWQEHVPPTMVEHCRLEHLTRGILTVSVSDSARRYELDRLLRTGLEKQLICAYRSGSLRKIRLILASPPPADAATRDLRR